MRRLLTIFRLVRYRFFLFAGLLPYLLGAAVAHWVYGAFDGLRFAIGLAGVALAVVGVEAFNEYFDARLGTDRVFAVERDEHVPLAILWVGIVALALAGGIGLWMARAVGWPVLFFAVLGGIAAAFYVGPPLRFAYRGLGETMIFFSYGPWMTWGSYYLQTGRLDLVPLLPSLVPGLMILALAVANEIPDFYQDRLVGKRNLVVRFGRRAGVLLYLGALALGFVVVAYLGANGAGPRAALLALAAVPFAVHSGLKARSTFEHPREFIPAVRSAVLCYTTGAAVFTGAYLL